MIRQYELVEQVKAYDPAADEELLDRAYVFSMKAHGTQTRASGDPYFSHPVEVAGILAGMKLDVASIATGLLHDTVEDTVATLDEIQELFGPEIGRLVDGVTKLSRIELQSDDARQAENFRKLLVAMSEDIRVLLVKLADRLHNMRTLHFVPSPEKRRRIARETMEIYAPLAERIGMQRMKDELADLAFAELNPEAHASVRARLDFLRSQGEDVVAKIVAELRETLVKAGIDGEVQGREKRAYSIWRKMEQKNVAFEQLSDVVAFRVIVGSIAECYAALGVVHGAYAMVPGRFKDYISTPKPNGYRSIHTVVYGPERQRIEIQIRTRDMHDHAELGVAAHWIYKAGSEHDPREGRQYRWVRELLEILDQAAGPEEFLEHTKLEMFQDQVFCFTPKGDLISLPRGATPVDFAYAVHSEVGDTCVGAKINGKLKPLRTQLANGDQVEVICSKSHTPAPGWESFVVTGRARSRVRRFIRSQQRQQYVQLGRSIFERAMEQYDLAGEGGALERARTALKYKSDDDLYMALGEGNVTGRAVVEAISPEAARRPAQTKVVPIAKRRADGASAHAVPIKGLIPGMAVHFAGCCHPLPGERIVGIVTTGKGVTVHTIDCETLHTFEETPERWIDLAWNVDPAKPEVHVGRISVLVANEPGMLGNMTTVIGRHRGNISNLKITSRSADFFEILVDVEVRDVRHLTNIIAALRADPAVNAVERARG